MRMPGSVPSPDKAPPSSTRSTERILGRPLDRLSPPEGHNSSTRDINRGSLAGPQAHLPDAPRRPVPDSAEEDDDLVPDNTRPRRVAWAPSTTQAGDHRQADKFEDTAGPICGRSGTSPVSQEKYNPPLPPSWAITKEEEQENGKWKVVLRATAGSLAEAHLMCMAALGEVVWDPPQGGLGASTRAQPDLCRCPQAE